MEELGRIKQEKNMVENNKYGTAEIQNALLDIIIEFHKFCEANDIKYGLYGGSCLGAVRHDGFIPWDDDLDIILDRPNYKRLMAKFNTCKTLTMQRTIWIQRIRKNNAKSINGYIPTLDVFVIDNAPENKFVFEMKVFILLMLQGMLKENINYKKVSLKYKICLFITHLIGRFFSKNLLRRCYDQVSQIGNKKSSKYVHCTNTSFRCLPRKYKADTWKTMVLHKFEDIQMYIPEKYEQYLTVMYGDYMVLPKEKNRVPEHAKKSNGRE